MFVIGVILTWLGIRRRVHDVLGESVPITGPILLAVGGLMLILAFRQFHMAHTRKIAHNKALQNKEIGEPATAALTENSDEHDFTESDLNRNKTTTDDTADPEEACSKTRLTSGSYYDSHSIATYSPAPVGGGGYLWPPAPLQNTFYSMAMLAYRDPKLLYGLYLSDTDRLGTDSTDTSRVVDFSTAAAAAATGGLHTSINSQQPDTAVLETSSSTLPQQTLPTSCSPSTPMSASRSESSKIFPVDHVKGQQRKNATSSGIASAGISNLPNPTAFMMLRTLELQETI